jgi:hypothetical protein
MSTKSGASYFILSKQKSMLSTLLTANTILMSRLANNNISDIKDYDTTHNTFISTGNKPGINILYDYYATPLTSGNFILNDNNELVFSLPTVGQQFINDIVINLELTQFGTPGSTTQYCYADWPGVRMFKEVRFIYDNLEIDMYTPEDVMFDRQYRIPLENRIQWDSGMGQARPKQAKLYNPDYQIEQIITIVDGAQTPKSVQPPLVMWIKLNFDFNQKIKNAFYIRPIVGGRREIRLSLADLSTFFFKKDPNGTITGATVGPSIQKAVMYVQNIYTSPDFYDYYLDTISYIITRTYQDMTRIITNANDTLKLDGLRYPTESIRFGFRPLENKNTPDRWYRYTKCSKRSIPYPMSQINPVNPTGPSILTRLPAEYYLESAQIDTILFSIRGDYFLYPDLPLGFFTRYISVRYGIDIASEDFGSGIITFNVKETDGNDNNGFLDLSTGESLIAKWTSRSQTITPTDSSELVLSARCLRILLLPRDSSVIFQPNSIITTI